MASPLLVKVTFLVVMCSVLSIPLGDAALSCPQLQFTVAPCLGYLRGPGAAVPAAPCCNAVRTINNQARTTPDRQGACRCLKSVAQNLPGLNLATLAALPAKCGVNLPFRVTPSIDCNK
uniref:Non-specific lipid-transfer protein n=2 Tax=Cajanus cajan TaxID=3821 RepID=A0A151UIE2_CAJCA